MKELPRLVGRDSRRGEFLRKGRGLPVQPSEIPLELRTARIIESPSMTRSELTDALAATQPHLRQADVEDCTKTILDAISDALCASRRVEIRGFGAFQVNQRPSRKGRNPKTGEAVAVPAKACPHFKPGKELRDRVDC